MLLVVTHRRNDDSKPVVKNADYLSRCERQFVVLDCFKVIQCTNLDIQLHKSSIIIIIIIIIISISDSKAKGPQDTAHNSALQSLRSCS